MTLLILLLIFSLELNIALLFGILMKKVDEEFKTIQMNEGLRLE